MSVSGVGGSNAWFTNWSTHAKNRADISAASPSASVGELGQLLGSGSGSGVHSVTGASGAQMNGQDASSFSQTIDSLSQSLQGGDVSGAQDAFAKLKSLLQSAGVHGHHHHHGAKKADASGATGGTSAFADAFGALGDALQNGDLTAAQDAFGQLQSLLSKSGNRLTHPPVSTDPYTAPTGGAIDLTA